jgi:uncharacterized protein (DUF1501 family)
MWPSRLHPQIAGNPLIHVGSRRWFLEVGAAGLGGMLLPGLQTAQANTPSSSGDKKSVILIWLSGGPSHIDMWDPKPDAPEEVRGPYKSIATKLPGVQFCEHLPKQASIADKLTIIRSVNCSSSNHTPITMQAGNSLARRTNDGKDGGGYPSMGSVAAKFRGANNPNMPPFVGLADSWASDVWGAGHMGSQFEPAKGLQMASELALPEGINLARLQDRENLRRQLYQFGKRTESHPLLGKMDDNTRRAYEMVHSGEVQKAFNVDEESQEIRDAYGKESLGQKALLARRLVEAGVTFVLVSGAWGYFDHHGDEVRWKGIAKGLTPLLPRVDQVLHTLVTDLEQRGLLDSTLILMMGEFGRSPKINKTAGRGHWLPVMSMLMAGGGLKHGQVIGSTDPHGGAIASRPVSPEDLAATTYQHLGIDLKAHWTDPSGRPTPLIKNAGSPLAELF